MKLSGSHPPQNTGLNEFNAPIKPLLEYGGNLMSPVVRQSVPVPTPDKSIDSVSKVFCPPLMKRVW